MSLLQSMRSVRGASALRFKQWLRNRRDERNKWHRYLDEFEEYVKQSAEMGVGVPTWGDRIPYLNDRTAHTSYEPHYTYHCAWACRMLAKNNPESHIDISSSINFVTMASAFIKITHYDFRPPKIRLDGLATGTASLSSLPFEDASVRSLSCLHVVEHIGLGRYGDSIDPLGDRKAASELTRVLASGGKLLVVIPVGRSRINFNAHRVYSFDEVCMLFDELTLQEHVLIPDEYESGWIQDPPPSVIDAQEWGCGCFAFGKR